MNRSSRNLLLVFLVPAAVVILGTWVMRSAFELRDRTTRAALESSGHIASINDLLKVGVDAETGARGYVITGEQEFLDPHDAALREFDGLAAKLQADVGQNPAQVARVARIRDTFVRWSQIVEERMLEPVRAGDPAAAAEFAKSGVAKHTFDGLRALADGFVAEERRVLERRKQDSDRAQMWTRFGALGAGAGVLVSILIAVWVVARFVRGMQELAHTAAALASGDLSARARVDGKDELGQLGVTMNLLAQRLDERNREASLLDRLREGLHSCQDRSESSRVLRRIAPHLFESGEGAVFLINSSREQVVREAAWRGEPPERFGLEDCWALRRGQPYLYQSTDAATLPCPHLTSESTTSICVPLSAGSDTLGVLYQQLPPGTQIQDAMPRQALLVSETVALSLANLKLRETLRNQAIRDQLTGLYNRRYMEETIGREIARATRTRTMLGLIIFDVDHFKKYNDTYGHSGGDTLLRALGALAGASFRTSDVVCRYGGEEFVAILPDSTLEGTVKRAESLRAAVKQMVVKLAGETLGAVSISLGVAVFPDDGESSDALISAADAALYRSKRAGRDRVSIATRSEMARDARAAEHDASANA